MDFKLQETIETTMYSATLVFNENVRKYLEDDYGFDMIITTIINDEPRYISAQDIINMDNSYNIEEALIKNKGILVLFPADNQLIIKLIPKCSNDTETIGFYSSKIYINFTKKQKDKNLILYAQLNPKLLRDPLLIQKENLPDPVLKDINLRAGYDFNTKISKSEELYNTNITYDTTEYLYVNTTITPTENMVPTYFSKLSAFGTEINDNEYYRVFDWENAQSYLYDVLRSKRIDIPYYVSDKKTINMNIVGNYKSNMTYYEIIQTLAIDEKPDKYKNKLIFDLTFI